MDLPDSSLVKEADILPLLTSIRRDAFPLIKLLLRLEEKSVTGLLDSDLQVNENPCSQKLEDERRQLDIDKSYLTVSLYVLITGLFCYYPLIYVGCRYTISL